MLTRADHQASDISGPAQGAIFALALVAATASLEQDFASATYFNNATFAPQFVTLKCSARWYITMKDATGVTAPDETSSTSLAAATTWEVAPDEPFQVRVAPGVRQFWKAKSASTCILRGYPSSSNPPAAA